MRGQLPCQLFCQKLSSRLVWDTDHVDGFHPPHSSPQWQPPSVKLSPVDSSLQSCRVGLNIRNSFLVIDSTARFPTFSHLSCTPPRWGVGGFDIPSPASYFIQVTAWALSDEWVWQGVRSIRMKRAHKHFEQKKVKKKNGFTCLMCGLRMRIDKVPPLPYFHNYTISPICQSHSCCCGENGTQMSEVTRDIWRDLVAGKVFSSHHLQPKSVMRAQVVWRGKYSWGSFLLLVLIARAVCCLKLWGVSKKICSLSYLPLPHSPPLILSAN